MMSPACACPVVATACLLLLPPKLAWWRAGRPRPAGAFDCAQAKLARRPSLHQQLIAANRDLFSELGPAHAPALQEVVDQFARGVIHLHVERFHAASQIVEHHDRRNRHEQADGGGYERFRDTARDRCQAGCLFLRDTVEGVQNADHRSEQSHEGSRRADCRQTAQATLQFGVHDGFGAFQCALGSFNGLAWNFARAILMGLEFHQARGDHLGQVTFLVALGHFDRFVNLAFAERPSNGGSERAGLIASGVESHPTVNHHADRPPRHDEQNDNHDLRQKTHLLPERNRVPTNRALVKEPGGEKMEITEYDCCQVDYHELLLLLRTSSNTFLNFSNSCSPVETGLAPFQPTRLAASLQKNRPLLAPLPSPRGSKTSSRRLLDLNRLMQEKLKWAESPPGVPHQPGLPSREQGGTERALNRHKSYRHQPVGRV